MIALAAVACATGLQAASFAWNTTTKITDSSGTAVASAAEYSAVLNGGSIVLVLLADGTYDGAKTILDGQTAPTVKTSPAAQRGRLSATYGFVYDDADGASNILKNDDILGVMFKDSSGNLSQLVYANGATVDDTYKISGLSNNTWVGSSFTFATEGNFTVAAVPEPTSGLLLLLGMAGLALKRKRA